MPRATFVRAGANQGPEGLVVASQVTVEVDYIHEVAGEC
jgi:hypothetical protein